MTGAERDRLYRARKKQAQEEASIVVQKKQPMTGAERQRLYRQRKKEEEPEARSTSKPSAGLTSSERYHLYMQRRRQRMQEDPEYAEEVRRLIKERNIKYRKKKDPEAKTRRPHLTEKEKALHRILVEQAQSIYQDDMVFPLTVAEENTLVNFLRDRYVESPVGWKPVLERLNNYLYGLEWIVDSEMDTEEQHAVRERTRQKYHEQMEFAQDDGLGFPVFQNT